MNVLSVEYGIPVDKLVAAMHDRASSNEVAMRTIKVLYHKLIDIGCYSHTIDHVGEKFHTPHLAEFMRLWISLFSHSPRTQFAWKELTGKSMASYSDTRWWSRWEVCNQVLLQFGDVHSFLLSHPDFSPVTTSKLLDILDNTQKATYLQLELAAIIDCGEKFVKATYNLEGDGPLVFQCYQILSELHASIQCDHYPNLTAVAKNLGPVPCFQQFLHYGKSCVKPGLDYFTSKFQNDLSESVAAFKAAQLFIPSKVDEMQPTSTEVDSLNSFPFVDDEIIQNLKTEMSSYVAMCKGVSPNYDVLKWWDGHSLDLPHWAGMAKMLCLEQP